MSDPRNQAGSSGDRNVRIPRGCAVSEYANAQGTGRSPQEWVLGPPRGEHNKKWKELPARMRTLQRLASEGQDREEGEWQGREWDSKSDTPLVGTPTPKHRTQPEIPEEEDEPWMRRGERRNRDPPQWNARAEARVQRQKKTQPARMPDDTEVEWPPKRTTVAECARVANRLKDAPEVAQDVVLQRDMERHLLPDLVECSLSEGVYTKQDHEMAQVMRKRDSLMLKTLMMWELEQLISMVGMTAYKAKSFFYSKYRIANRDVLGILEMPSMKTALKKSKGKENEPWSTGAQIPRKQGRGKSPPMALESDDMVELQQRRPLCQKDLDRTQTERGPEEDNEKSGQAPMERLPDVLPSQSCEKWQGIKDADNPRDGHRPDKQPRRDQQQYRPKRARGMEQNAQVSEEVWGRESDQQKRHFMGLPKTSLTKGDGRDARGQKPTGEGKSSKTEDGERDKPVSREMPMSGQGKLTPPNATEGISADAEREKEAEKPKTRTHRMSTLKEYADELKERKGEIRMLTRRPKNDDQ